MRSANDETECSWLHGLSALRWSVNACGLIAVALLLAGFALVRLDHGLDAELQSLYRLRSDALQVAGEFRVRLAVLTHISRQYAATGDPIYLRYYETEIAIHEGMAPAPPDHSGRF